METLETLSRFIERFKQKEGEELRYVFVGGTAVRLHQEKDNFVSDHKRNITDFDIISFSGKRYPVHTFDPDDVQGLVYIQKEDLLSFVASTGINGRDIYFMNGDFISASKLCMIDHPREKDYDDVLYLRSNNHIIPSRLKYLFETAPRLTKKSDLVMGTFNYLMDNDPVKIKLFQGFSSLVNLLDDFENPEVVRELLYEYALRDRDKTGHGVNSVLYDTHAVIKEVNEMSEEQKAIVLDSLLSLAENNTYVDYDQIVHQDLVPKVRYSRSIDEKFKIIDNLVLAQLDAA
ncbi:hypothetical protein COU57_02880 [Candidatus Pacearchaeota archaeon CG10_big_fil_rev_8_21_14_0_10_32_14]|nr:MAG: hypothetical protein COU57_02880 [Candidatus Pacearchaeota archaeon CG10_big_fil_rev_8_21_14_0_10_32_14]